MQEAIQIEGEGRVVSWDNRRTAATVHLNMYGFSFFHVFTSKSERKIGKKLTKHKKSAVSLGGETAQAAVAGTLLQHPNTQQRVPKHCAA